MAEHRIELFAAQDAISKQDVVDFWVREGAVAADEAQRRTAELLLVGLTAAGELAGVSTAYLQRQAQLGMDLWHFRLFVGKEHRRSALAIDMAREARDELARRWNAFEDRRGGGVMYEVESDVLKQGFPDAVWPRLQFAYVGQDAQGRHLRVCYFPGAYAPEPWPGVGAAPST